MSESEQEVRDRPAERSIILSNVIGGAVLVLLTMAVNSLDKIEDAMSLFRSDIAVLKVQNSILKDDLKAHRNDKRSHQ